MRLNVAICTYNRAELLQRTLNSINQARRPTGWDIEVIVVANACTDNTVPILSAYQQSASQKDRLPLLWTEEPRPGKSNALNRLNQLVNASIVAFVDDDHRIHEGYLESICKAVVHYTDANLFCGRIIPDWDGSEPEWVHDTGPYRIYPLPVPRFDLGDKPKVLGPGTAIPGGGNLFLRREWLDRVGAFSPDLGPKGHDLGGAEDLEWVTRALDLGMRLQYVPDVVQYHYVDSSRLTLPYMIKKAYTRSAASVRFSNDEHSGGGIPTFMYRKLLIYLIMALASLRQNKRRFYLVRVAAAMGEIRGYLHLHRDRLQPKAPSGSGGD